jgi:transcriptional regulator with XRE-family HTH domain
MSNEAIDERLVRQVRARLRELRQERGLTQEQLCERAGVSLDLVNRVEGGKRTPGLATLARLAAALGVSVVDLLGDERPPPVSSQAAAVRRVAALLERQPDAVVAAAERVISEFVRAVQAASPTRRR